MKKAFDENLTAVLSRMKLSHLQTRGFYNFPFHFQILLNCMYVLLVSPIWLSLSKNQEFELKECFPQKVWNRQCVNHCTNKHGTIVLNEMCAFQGCFLRVKRGPLGGNCSIYSRAFERQKTTRSPRTYIPSV